MSRGFAIGICIDNARRAHGLTQSKTRGDLDTEWVEALALVRLLEVIGEAANRVPDFDRALRHEIPWSEIIGLRNRLIHGYD
jgi:uncharacterized protein with HEPN domain